MSSALQAAPYRVSVRFLSYRAMIGVALSLIFCSILVRVAFGQAAFELVGILMAIIGIPLVLFFCSRCNLALNDQKIIVRSRLYESMLYGRKERSWQDIACIRLRNARFLIFDFKSGGMLPLPLDGFDSANLEQIFWAISRFADPLTLNPDVLAMQRTIFIGGAKQDSCTQIFTQMWLDSMSQSFEVTNFVPLKGGQTLRDGQLSVMMPLASGGMSSVYLVQDRDDRRMVLKELAVSGVGESEAKMHDLFCREATLLARLAHPNIVAVLDHFVENDRDYLLLDFVKGLNLRQHVMLYGSMKSPQIWKIASVVADILDYLHGLSPQIVHRDLTPDNLIFADGKITLIDFGAASDYVSGLTGTMIGKQCYIPPEQFQGHATTKSDLYALGCTLYFIATGKDPEPIEQSMPETGDRLLDLLIADLTVLDPDQRLADARTVINRARSRVAKIAEVVSV
jgi:hypothetical protein